jgi:hypothetical protein
MFGTFAYRPMLCNIFYLSSNTLPKNSHSLTKLSDVWNICPSFINQIERCLCHWMCKLEAYKFSLSIRREGAMHETQEEGE